jgi:diguanylate cyclase (GGDEF)-like protein
VREVDTVARFGGDEFVVILSKLNADREKSATEACRIAEKICAKLAGVYALENKRDGVETAMVEHYCTSSIGVVLFADHESGQDELLRSADMAMYRAKRNGRNQVCFAG